MSGSQVIHATKLFTKSGRSKQVNLVRELIAGGVLGLAVGSVWQVYHWNEKRKVEEYYYTLAKLDQQKEQ